MMHLVPCPMCQRQFDCPPEWTGKHVQCPACGCRFLAGAAFISPVLPPNTPMSLSREETEGWSSSTLPSLSPSPADEATTEASTGAGRSSTRPWVFASIALAALATAVAISLREDVAIPQRVENVLPPKEVPVPAPVHPPDVDAQTAEQVKTAIVAIIEAGRARDAVRLIEHFDSDLTLEVARSQLNGVRAAVLAQPKTAKDYRRALQKSFQENDDVLWGVDRIEVARIQNVGQGKTAAYVRIFREKQHLRARWWLSNRTGPWRIYDVEELDIALRTSDYLVIASEADALEFADRNREIEALRNAVLALMQSDAPKAAKLLQPLEKVQLDARLSATYHSARGLLALHEDRAEDALRAWKIAESAKPDMPILALYQGMALNRMRKHVEALARLEHCRSLIGDDPQLCEQTGFALEALQRFPEAVVQYRKALDLNPKYSPDAFLGLVRSLPPDASRDDLGERFAKLDNRLECYKRVAEDCLKAKDGLNLEPIAQEMLRQDLQHADAKFHLCLAKVWTRQGREAARVFAAFYGGRQQDKGQRERLDRFLQALTDFNQTEHIYPFLAHIQDVFPLMAKGLVKAQRMDDLSRAVREHDESFPGDPKAALFRAMILAQDGKFIEADQMFQSGVAKETDAETLALTQGVRIKARFFTGNALAAVADITPAKETLLQLVEHCRDQQDEKQTEQILDAYGKKHPDAAELWQARVALLVRQRQFEEAILLFKTNWARLSMHWPESDRKHYVEGFLMRMMDAAKPIEAYRAAPDAKEAFAFLCRDLDGSILRDACKTLIAVHAMAHPGDPWIFLLNGRLHLAEKDWTNAIEELDKARRLLPAAAAAEAKTQLVDARYRAGQSLAAYQEIGPSEAIFVQLATSCHQDKKWNELETLIEAHRPVALNDSQLAVYEARMRARQKRPDDALRIFLKWAENQTPPGGSDSALDAFVQDMTLTGFGMDVYRSLKPFKERAFDALARNWILRQKTERLTELLSEHTRSKPGDAKAEFYRGELLFLKGEYAMVQKAWNLALAQDSTLTNLLRKDRLYTVHVKLGTAVEMLRENGGGTQTFNDLCQTCLVEKESDQLVALIAERKQTNRDDPHLPAWEIESHWMRKDYESAWKILVAQGGSTPFRQLYRSKYDNYRVRTLIKLNRVKEAVQEAGKLSQGRTATPIWLILAHAADGNVTRTSTLMESQRNRTVCYEDPELGPLLRSDAFKPVRDKLP